MSEVTYLYSVNPKRLIKNIPGLPLIRSPRSFHLNKEQVRECLKYGSVYRRFANENRNERVTISTVDRFHNAKYMTEEEYTKFMDSQISNSRGTVFNESSEIKVEETKVTDEKQYDYTIPEVSSEIKEETSNLVNTIVVDVPKQEAVETKILEKPVESVKETPKFQYNNHKNNKK